MAMSLRPDGNTGVHAHVQQLRSHLDKDGIPSLLITPFSWGRLLRYPVFGLRRVLLDPLSQPAGILWYRHWHEVFLRNALRRTLTQTGACVVYAQDPLAARAALRARRGSHQQVVLVVHFRISQADEVADGGGIKRGGRVFRSIREVERRTIPRTDRIVYVSRWGRDALFGWLPDAAAVPSTIMGNFVEPLPTGRREEPWADLVTTGRLEPAKNQRFLLEVLAHARQDGHALTLDLFGDGPSREELELLATKLGVEHQVRFRGFRSDVREFLPDYRVYVHASNSESLPIAIIEAMAAGLPIVAGDSGGIAEMCDEGIEGRFWPLDDPAEAAAVLMRCLDDEPARLHMAAAARDRFRRDYDAAVVAPRLYAFLLGVPVKAVEETDRGSL